MQLCIIIHNLAVLSFQMMTASKYTGCTEGIVKQVSWPNLRIHELPLRWLDPDKFIRLFICFSHQALMWRKLAQRPVVEVLLPAALAKRQLERCLSQRMLRWRKTSQEERRRTQRNNPKRKIQKLKKPNLCRKTSKRFLFNISIPCSDFFDQLHLARLSIGWELLWFLLELRLRDKSQKARELASDLNTLGIPHQEAFAIKWSWYVFSRLAASPTI